MRLNSFIIHLYKSAVANPRRYIYLPLAIYWTLLFILTTVPSKSLPVIATSDKVKHFAAYLILTILLHLAIHFRMVLRKRWKYGLPVVIIIVVLYGLADEVHQYFIPGRYCELLDLVANYIGLLVGITISSYLIRIGSSSVN